MIILRWSKFPGADVASYKVYCSMVGFRLHTIHPSVVAGKTLILKMNDGDEQTITFDGETGLADQLNATLIQGHAYESSNPDWIYVRSDVRTAPGSVEIVDGTALEDFGLVARTIYEKSEDFLIGSVEAPLDPSSVVEYPDPDGVCQDWYTVTTVNSQGQESAKTIYKQPTTNTGNLCVLEGIVTSLQGVRLPDCEVTATLVKYPHESSKASQISLDTVRTYTGPDGRFSLALLQGALVILEIPVVGFSHNITVPRRSHEFITDILVDLDYRYPVEYNG